VVWANTDRCARTGGVEIVHFLIDTGEPRKIEQTFRAEGCRKVGEGGDPKHTYEICVCQVGDIVCEEVSLGVERKTVGDFWNSLTGGGHLQSQALDLINTFEHSFIMISDTARGRGLRRLEGFVNPVNGQVAIRPALAMMASLVSRYVKKDEEGNVIKGVQLIPGLTDKMLVVLTIAIAEKLPKDPITIARTRRKRVNVEDAPLQILMGIPGVDKHRAGLLLDEFGSVANLAKYDEGEIEKIKGIGPVTASLVYDGLHKGDPDD